MHKCVLKPLKAVLSLALQEFQVRSGEWRSLKENLALAKGRQPQELGVTVSQPPHPMAIEKIRQRFLAMGKLYSPEKKVHMLLKVCRLVYAIMEDNSGVFQQKPASWVSFSPVLTAVLPLRAPLRCGRLPSHADLRAGSV